ncbi:MAG: hypothetical protein V1698_01270 [bacterium]
MKILVVSPLLNYAQHFADKFFLEARANGQNDIEFFPVKAVDMNEVKKNFSEKKADKAIIIEISGLACPFKYGEYFLPGIDSFLDIFKESNPLLN